MDCGCLGALCGDLGGRNAGGDNHRHTATGVLKA